MSVDGPRKDAASREMRTVFITYLNVLDVSSHYMSRVLAEVGNEQSLARLLSPKRWTRHRQRWRVSVSS